MPAIELALAWIQYLTRQLNHSRSLQGLQAQLERARSEYQDITSKGFSDPEELKQPLAELVQAIQDAEQRLFLLNQVVLFNQDANPSECQCTHARIETGVFYNSIKAIQCFSCHGWQTIRKVIQ